MDITNTETQNAVHTPDCEESIPDTLRMVTPEDAARAGLRSIILTLGFDEVLVLGRIAERLRNGQQPGRRRADPLTGKGGIGRGKDAGMGSSSPGLFRSAAVLGGVDSDRRKLFRHRGKLGRGRGKSFRGPGTWVPTTGELHRASSEVSSRSPDALLRSWEARTRTSAERTASPEGLSDGQGRTTKVAGGSV